MVAQNGVAVDPAVLNSHFKRIRKEYLRGELIESRLFDDPVQLFITWYQEAVGAKCVEPNAMTLATASKTGAPSARILLLKQFDERGFIFYSNYKSRKGQDLEENPRAAAVFYWGELERQVRIEGKVKPLPKEENQAYFWSRPRGSQLSAAVSPQSEVVPDRKFLETKMAALETKASGGKLPVPEAWGGYVLMPERWEFWQGRENRLHDRIEYKKARSKGFKIARLAP